MNGAGETPAVRRRRLAHERALDRAGGAETEQGQALLERWHHEDLAERRASRALERKAEQGHDA